MHPSLFDLLLIILLVFLNGFLAMSEIAIVSARKGKLRHLAEAGDSRAHAALELANNPTPFLSTIQIGITMIGILAGAFGGATLSEHLAEQLSLIPWLKPSADALGFGIVVFVITYLSLIIGELVPKRIAIDHAEMISCAIAKPMTMTAKIASPVVQFLAHSTEIVLRASSLKPSSDPPISPEELKILLAQGTQAGVFDKSEQDILEEVLSLGERNVAALMTPISSVVWLDVNDSVAMNMGKMMASIHERFPLCDGSIDTIVGIVQAKSAFAEMITSKQVHFRNLAEKPLFILDRLSALQALDSFRQTKTHTAIIVDEYGTIRGLLTLIDVVQSLIGAMPTHGEEPKWQATMREDGSWLIDGRMPVDEFVEMFALPELASSDSSEFATIAGFVLNALQHVPEPSESIEWKGIRFEVVDMDGHRIDKILVSGLTRHTDTGKSV